jgi:hypothetical protein
MNENQLNIQLTTAAVDSKQLTVNGFGLRRKDGG